MADNYPATISGLIDNFSIDVDSPGDMFNELSITDVYVQESILSPQLQISVTFNDTTHLIKNYLQYKIKSGEMPKVRFNLKNPMFDVPDSVPIGGEYRGGKTDSKLEVAGMVVYRMDNRRNINYHLEEFTLHFCHPSTILNLKSRMSDFYRMQEVSKIVRDGLKSVDSSARSIIDKTDLRRDYMSNNQHPFQVISEIADMAMANKRTQFLHYMTTESISGLHYFKSIKNLIKQEPIFTFFYNEKGANQQLTDINNIMVYEFPCDFDTLLDLTGGIIHNSKDYANHRPSMVSMNPFDGGMFLVDGKVHGDRKTQGFGGTLNAGAWSNLNNFESNKPYGAGSSIIDAAMGALTGGPAGALSALSGGGGMQVVGDASRPSQVEKYLHRRTEAITHFHRESVDLKIVVPFNPYMHVGKVIDVRFQVKRDYGANPNDFGSGRYLICHMTHTIKVGSYGTTTMELIKIEDKSKDYKELRSKHQILKDLPGL